MKKDDLDSVDVAIRWTVWTVALAFIAAGLVTLLALWTANEAKAADVTPKQLSGGMCTEFANGEWREVKCPAPLTPSQARDILAVAYGQYHGHRTLLDNPPPVHIASREELQRRYGCTEHCPPIHGIYEEETGEIYVYGGIDFSTVYGATVLMHEFIHHFQVKTKGRVMDMKLPQYELCLEVMAREHEAYRIQWEVLLKAGEYMLAQSVRIAAGGYYCKKPETQ